MKLLLYLKMELFVYLKKDKFDTKNLEFRLKMEKKGRRYTEMTGTIRT